MASIYGPAYCITGKIPHLVLKQACNQPVLSPALSPTEGTQGKHRGRITLNTKKALGEQSVGLCSTCNATQPHCFQVCWEKHIKFFFTARPKEEISSSHKMGPQCYFGPLCDLTLGLLLKPSNRNWLTVQRFHTKKAQGKKVLLFFKKR